MVSARKLTSVKTSPIGSSLATPSLQFAVKFPGYGLSSLGEKAQPDGSVLTMMSVEIPQRDKDRYFVARELQNRLALVDDFAANSSTNVVSEVKLEGAKLFYFTRQGARIREHLIEQ